MKYKVTEYQGENCIVRIHKPILSAEEKETRVEELKQALVRFGRETRSKT